MFYSNGFSVRFNDFFGFSAFDAHESYTRLFCCIFSLILDLKGITASFTLEKGL